MSRSYKKHPYITDHRRGSTKHTKQLANRAFRRKIAKEENLPIHPLHKRYTDSWMITDYKWRMSKAEAIAFYQTRVKDINWREFMLNSWPTLEDYLRMWAKHHYRK